MRRRKVRDVMTADVVTVRADTSYGDVVSVFAEHRLSGVPAACRAAAHATRFVPGVIGGVDQITWASDDTDDTGVTAVTG